MTKLQEFFARGAVSLCLFLCFLPGILLLTTPGCISKTRQKQQKAAKDAGTTWGEVRHFTYKGHSYIHWGTGDYSGCTHDPDCKHEKCK